MDTDGTGVKAAEDFFFEEMAVLIQEKEAEGCEFQVFIRNLEEEMVKAKRRVEVALAIANICMTTKTRKPRSDKGKKRNAVSPKQDKPQ